MRLFLPETADYFLILISLASSLFACVKPSAARIKEAERAGSSVLVATPLGFLQPSYHKKGRLQNLSICMALLQKPFPALVAQNTKVLGFCVGCRVQGLSVLKFVCERILWSDFSLRLIGGMLHCLW